MKKLKLLILAYGLLAAQVAVAVTLPTTSYSGTSSQVGTDGVFTSTSGSMITGSFNALGAGTAECDAACQAAFNTCMSGGGDLETCGEAQTTCMKECQGDDDTPLGPDSPIEGGLWILLAMAVVTCIVKLGIEYRWRLFDK